MSMLEALGLDFERTIRDRGRAYYEKNAVKITQSSPSSILARVKGNELYTVRILWDAAYSVDCRCSCPYFADHGQCKHIWATLLAADAQDLLPDSKQEDIDSSPVPIGRLSDVPSARARPKGRRPAWKDQLESLRVALRGAASPLAAASWPASKRIVYLLDIEDSISREQALVVEIAIQTLDHAGNWAHPKKLSLRKRLVASIPHIEDRTILRLLAGSAEARPQLYGGYYDASMASKQVIRGEDYELILRPMLDTGRCFARVSSDAIDPEPLRWDSGPPWELWVKMQHETGNHHYAMTANFRRPDQQIDAMKPLLALSDGLVIVDHDVARLSHFGAFPMLAYLRARGPMSLTLRQVDEMLHELLGLVSLERLDLPSELGIRQVNLPMRPRLKILAPPRQTYMHDRLVGELSFDYQGRIFPENQSANLFDLKTRTILHRNLEAENDAGKRLDGLGLKFVQEHYSGTKRRLRPTKLNQIVLALTAEGWYVEAEGKLYRQAGEFKINVKSGIDWFELEGKFDFDGVGVSLPRLLEAIRKGEKTVQLDDGTVGILPEQWLSRFGLLARVAGKDKSQVRFEMRQVGVLDALLSNMPEVTSDEAFRTARAELEKFDRIVSLDAPDDFKGHLRPYQREGLGWLRFLEKFGFGGCLADDMGLGKTVQVLAMLAARHKKGPPSLVVVPKSLVFNWIEEARRFTPQLRILDHTGVGRLRSANHFREYDVILTTYGTLRLDAPFLKDFAFEYAILDEAQAVKNSASESAKAVRLIRANHRLALSGTPIQNHLGELWSLFEFLNPGMLGGASVFNLASTGSNQMQEEERGLLSRALRPFILRRTKEQVATDLPAKTEQTLWCDLNPEQRKLYDELRDHYRGSLLKRIDSEGMNKAKILVLEALLRLRQAACHPGLIDKALVGHTSAKLDALLPKVVEILDEGHKILVFSQFTSMLAIVKHHLDRQKIEYEYLDGKTRDRQAKVERFQNDPTCKLFLISLKAGGLGLNLTAAEYVFLLDPWWNPAVESQAIDRAHRIGQSRHVFAYRIIARDTVEQKVLELQSRKKNLADMIINADNSLIGKLKREDLELLLA